jgi:hypothetical protein
MVRKKKIQERIEMTELKIQTIQIMVAIENLALLKSHHF